jgi:hypothetical protein
MPGQAKRPGLRRELRGQVSEPLAVQPSYFRSTFHWQRLRRYESTTSRSITACRNDITTGTQGLFVTRLRCNCGLHTGYLLSRTALLATVAESPAHNVSAVRSGGSPLK